MVGIDWITRMLAAKRREKKIAAAKSWPTVVVKSLKATVVERDPIAEGSSFATSQVEIPFYFSNEAGYFGGHARSVAMSDSEAHRVGKQMPEDTEFIVRYNPANPDETCAFAQDNAGRLPVELWAS